MINIPFLVIFIFLILSCILNECNMNEISLSLCIYLLYKWIYNDNKCTISYLESKIRNIDITESYVYKCLSKIININQHNYCLIIYIITLIVLYIQIGRI
jgi:hypothetical protein